MNAAKLSPASRETLARMRRHPHAPLWNYTASDRLDEEGVAAVRRFADELAENRLPFGESPPDRILAWIEERRAKVPSFRRRAPSGRPLDFASIATSSREDIALRPEDGVPDDAPLERLIVYRTAGTTGHALLVPHEARAAALYLPLLELALARHGVRPHFTAEAIACFLVGAQARTVTYPTVLAAWGGAGFAKLNLRAGEWRDPRDPPAFFADLAPQILTGDPIAFAEMMRLDVAPRPLAMVTTAVAMSRGLHDKLVARHRCPVVDWYSLTETGPIAYACRADHGYHVLSHDLYVEALGPDHRPVARGERGEIAVTGGRNPFVPLLRYRTGDWGAIEDAPCPCGDPMPRLVQLEGRAPVLFRANDGRTVNPVDVSGALRRHPIVQHELVQHADRSLTLTLRIAADELPTEEVRSDISALFGRVELAIRCDPCLGDRAGKHPCYRTELLED